MTTKERLLIAAVFVIALVGGGFLATRILGGGGGPAATSSPIAVASGSPSPTPPVTAPPTTAPPTTAPPTESPSASPSPPATASASPSPTAAPSVTPAPSPTPGAPATIALSGLRLDAKDDPDGRDRSIGFHTDGAGDVTAKVSVHSPQGNVVMCLGSGGGQPDCSPSGTGVLTAAAPDGGGDFVLTLRGAASETPIVDVTLTFPATAPAVIVAGARFDGTLYPETNGITATVTPRRKGDLALAADWGGHPFLYAVDLREEGGAGSQVLADQGPATRMSETLPVTAPNPWKVVLKNAEEGFGPTELDATIAWP